MSKCRKKYYPDKKAARKAQKQLQKKFGKKHTIYWCEQLQGYCLTTMPPQESRKLNKMENKQLENDKDVPTYEVNVSYFEGQMIKEYFHGEVFRSNTPGMPMRMDIRITMAMAKEIKEELNIDLLPNIKEKYS